MTTTYLQMQVMTEVHLSRIRKHIQW